MRPPTSREEEPTVVQTRPGTPRRTPPLTAALRATVGGAAGPSATAAPVDIKSYRGARAFPKNPLITAAGTLFDLMVELSTTTEHPDVAALQRQVVEEVQRFEQRATSSGSPSDHVLAARYALCSALDETVLLTPWGGESVWSQRSLLSIFQNETWGGEKLFALLQRLRQDPARNVDVNELIALTLALGFEGRYRVMENGRAELEDLRNELYREINRQRSASPRPLSVDWEGVNAGRGVRQIAPIWVLFAVTGVAILGMFTWFDVQMHRIKDPMILNLDAIAPTVPGS